MPTAAAGAPVGIIGYILRRRAGGRRRFLVYYPIIPNRRWTVWAYTIKKKSLQGRRLSRNKQLRDRCRKASVRYATLTSANVIVEPSASGLSMRQFVTWFWTRLATSESVIVSCVSKSRYTSTLILRVILSGFLFHVDNGSRAVLLQTSAIQRLSIGS